jgi:hypothetical protein
MKIDEIALSKICIKYAQFDPHPIWNFVSGFTKKRVERTLSELQSQNQGNPQATESALIHLIQENFQGRKKPFAKYLLMAAIPKKMISAPKAKEIAESLGLAGPDFEQYLTQHFGEEPNVDIFEELAGTKNNTVEFPKPVPNNTMQQDLQIAASLKNKQGK